MKVGVLITIIALLFIECKKPKEVTNISVEDLSEQLMVGKIQLLDVRTPNEWEEGIINGALKINVLSHNFEAKTEELLNKKKPVYIYCRSGAKSLVACEMLLEKGYEVYNVDGGYLDWLDRK